MEHFQEQHKNQSKIESITDMKVRRRRRRLGLSYEQLCRFDRHSWKVIRNSRNSRALFPSMSLSLVNYRAWWASINCWKSAKQNKISFVKIITVTSCKSVICLDRIKCLVNLPFDWTRKSNGWSKIWRSVMKTFFDFCVYTRCATNDMPATSWLLSSPKFKPVEISPTDTSKWFEGNVSSSTILF